MFEPAVHKCAPGPSRLNIEHFPIFNSGKNCLIKVKTISNFFFFFFFFCRKIYDKVEVESLTEL